MLCAPSRRLILSAHHSVTLSPLNPLAFPTPPLRLPRSFVTDNARRLLKLDNPPVLAVSSRAAIRAKQAVALPDADSSVVSYDADALASNADWKASGFDSLESLVYAFLVGEGQGREAGAAEGGTEARASGAGDTAVEAPTGKQRGVGEGVRLKLQTPLSVADALMGVTAAKLGTEIDAAKVRGPEGREGRREGKCRCRGQFVKIFVGWMGYGVETLGW